MVESLSISQWVSCENSEESEFLRVDENGNYGIGYTKKYTSDVGIKFADDFNHSPATLSCSYN